MFVYRHCLSPRERVGVYCDALPRYQPYTLPPLAYTSSLPPHVLSLIENVFACTDKWPQFLGHITDQISEATLGLGLFIISLHSILADVVCQTHASLQCVVCFCALIHTHTHTCNLPEAELYKHMTYTRADVRSCTRGQHLSSHRRGARVLAHLRRPYRRAA